MGMFERPNGAGPLTFDAMFSLDAATVGAQGALDPDCRNLSETNLQRPTSTSAA
jgi:hypothetical protein